MQKQRCSSVDRLPQVIEEETRGVNARIFESDDESGDETSSSGKITGFLDLSAVIDKHERQVDSLPAASV